jgi:hypothetical protein
VKEIRHSFKLQSQFLREAAMSDTSIPFWASPLVEEFSRRRFLRTAAGTAGAAFGATLLWPTRARADDDIVMPNPIPGGLTGEQLGCPGVTELFHLFGPSYPAEDEPSTITDFNGFHGDAHIQGFGTARNTMTGEKTRLFYDADIRFMKGLYVGVDGDKHFGAFALV